MHEVDVHGVSGGVDDDAAEDMGGTGDSFA